MKTKQTYYQNSTALFEGFYESNLFNSDTEYYISENLESPHEIKDFHAFCEQVSKKATDLLDPCDEVLSDFEFVRLDSPRYYNYGTDRLVISCQVDIEALHKFAFESNRDAFDLYLHEHFTSYDGFISFVPNNVEDFERNVKDVQEDAPDNLLDVLIEFYLLKTIDLERYHIDLDEYAYELAYEMAEPCSSDSDQACGTGG